MQLFQQSCKRNPIIFVVGNKLDLASKRAISKKQIEEWISQTTQTQKFRLVYFGQIAVKHNFGVDTFFNYVQQEVFFESFKPKAVASKFSLKLLLETRKKRQSNCISSHSYQQILSNHLNKEKEYLFHLKRRYTVLSLFLLDREFNQSSFFSKKILPLCVFRKIVAFLRYSQ